MDMLGALQEQIFSTNSLLNSLALMALQLVNKHTSPQIQENNF